MRIIIYVMSFFIISAEKFCNEKDIFLKTKYVHHEKYANLQARCVAVLWEKGYAGYIREIYLKINVSWISQMLGISKLVKLKNHKYYENDLIQLKVYEKYSGEKENVILPTLLPLLDAIPDKIIIKKGIIYTVKNSLVSGIDITETIPTAPTTNSNNATYTDIPTRLDCYSRATEKSKYADHEHVMPPQPSGYADLEYVIMDGAVMSAHYRCKYWLQDKKNELSETSSMEIIYGLSDEETEKEIIKKIDMPCTLRLNTQTIMNNFVENLTVVLNANEENMYLRLFTSYVPFELRFSYICKFVSPLQTFVNKNILQYKILNFTVSSYQLKKVKFFTQSIGLTYCLQHQHINNYVSNLDEYFLYKFVV
ncbi:uncharacterized protein LOC142332939 [Lycorma delicatula]|uniref:uncharacterized protein LOC142332939 n=1 Tax=Lycorma delicatula TaxID=130591 RepID=UPI003F511BE8